MLKRWMIFVSHNLDCKPTREDAYSASPEASWFCKVGMGKIWIVLGLYDDYLKYVLSGNGRVTSKSQNKWVIGMFG